MLVSDEIWVPYSEIRNVKKGGDKGDEPALDAAAKSGRKRRRAERNQGKTMNGNWLQYVINVKQELFIYG